MDLLIIKCLLKVQKQIILMKSQIKVVLLAVIHKFSLLSSLKNWRYGMLKK